MGTFHQDKSDLHGITVVVDTTGDAVYVGRCDDEDQNQVILLDADVHRADSDEIGKQEWIERAAQYGVWKKFDRLVIPRAEVTSIRRLGDF